MMETDELSEIKKFYKKLVFDTAFYPSHYLVAKQVASFNPKSILEFGSAMGKNWINIRDMVSRDTTYKGIDINLTHMLQAADLGIDVILGDERRLKEFDDNSYDVVFTSSVINHLPAETAKWTVEQFKRIARTAVVLCESIEKKEWRWYIHPYTEWGFKDLGVKATNEQGLGQTINYRLFVLRS